MFLLLLDHKIQSIVLNTFTRLTFRNTLITNVYESQLNSSSLVLHIISESSSPLNFSSTRSYTLVTLLYTPIHSRLKMTNRFFWHAAPYLWNKRSSSFRIPSSSVIHCASSASSDSVPIVGISLLQSRPKTYSSSKSFPP